MIDLSIAVKTEKLVEWLKHYLKKAGAAGFVVGLSGGIDSAVVLALCKRASPDSTLGIAMPCYSDPQDLSDAKLVADALKVPFREIVLDNVFDEFLKIINETPYSRVKEEMRVANIKPRLRMNVLYYYAALYNYLVAGTSNRCEIVTGYFTKYGDGGVDLQPLARLVKSEVRNMACILGIPERLIEKPPTAGLWEGQCDEEEMGLSYEELDKYLLTGEASDRTRRRIEEIKRRSEHKLHSPPMPPF